MAGPDKDISDWDKTFTARWQAAIRREFGSGGAAAYKLSEAGINPATLKAWFNKGGRPTVANLCLVARAARDPSAFIVEVCGDEPWARELGVSLQRRRLKDAEVAVEACHVANRGTPVDVIRALSGPMRRYRYVTDTGVMTPAETCPDQAALRMVGLRKSFEGTASDYVMARLGWILVEDGGDAPVVIQCHAMSVSDTACQALIAAMEAEVPRHGAVLRVLMIDWVEFPCATVFQLHFELARTREVRGYLNGDSLAPSSTAAAAGDRVASERRGLAEVPPSGAEFARLWAETGGVVGPDMIHRLQGSRMFDLGGIFGVEDHQFRVGYVGPKLRMPAGMTRERMIGHNLLEIQASRGFGAMVASHYTLAAYERSPVVHLVRVTSRRSYRRVSFPIFEPRARKVVAIIGFSDARITEKTHEQTE